MSIFPRYETAPCVLQDLIAYDPRKAASHYTNTSFLKSKCSHAYVTPHDRSRVPDLDERPDVGTVWKVAAVCRECRCHLTVVITFGESVELVLFPCPNREFPLHHFRLNNPGGEAADDGCRTCYSLECTAPQCRAHLQVEIRFPIFESKDVLLLTDRNLLKTRFQAALVSNPNAQPVEPIQVLANLRAYVADSLRETGNDHFPAMNKRFMVSLGNDSWQLLTRFGFTYVEQDRDTGKAAWYLPKPTAYTAEQREDSLRAMLEDARDELTILMSQRPDTEKAFLNESFHFSLSTYRDLERLFGTLDYDTTLSSRRNLQAQGSKSYKSLGASQDFSDSLIAWTYDRQVFCDPENSSHYFQDLKEIATIRESETLETKAVMVESTRLAEPHYILDTALRYFSNGSDDAGYSLTDEEVLTVYHSRITNVGLQEQNTAKRHLLAIGEARNSGLLLQAGSDTIDTVEQALAWLGVNADTEDEFIESIVVSKTADDPASKDLARKAVKIIANARNSSQLRRYLEQTNSETQQKTIHWAWSALGLVDSLEMTDQLLVDNFVMPFLLNNEGSQTRKAEVREALAIIARERDSVALNSWLRDLETQNLQPKITDPRGLGNIGNTCYLNSLLQYFFTVRPVRELVQNLGHHRELLTPGIRVSKKVGNSEVKKAQVIRAQEFISELDKLFQRMVKARTPSVNYEKSLARLTLVNVVDDGVDERVRRRSTVTGDRAPIMANEQPMAAPTDKTIIEYNNNSTAMLTDSPGLTGADIDDDHMSDSPTVVEEEWSQPNEEHPAGNERAKDAHNSGELDARTSTADDPDQMNLDESLPNSICVEASTTRTPLHGGTLSMSPSLSQGINYSIGNPPPVPPRPQANDQEPHFEEFARQQDVREVIQNVLHQFRWAIKPEALEQSGESIDIISSVFYGKEQYVTIKANGDEEPKTQPFYDFWVYLAAPCDIYTAIDGTFDRSEVGGSPGVFQYRTMEEIPVILQISISRIGFNKETNSQFKVDHQLKLYEEIYMDRYQAEDQMLEKRRKSWYWKAELEDLKHRKAELTAKEIGIDMSDAVQITRGYLADLSEAANDIGIDVDTIDQDLLDALEIMAVDVRKETAEINTKIGKLEMKLSSLFSEDNELLYRLHAVFVHRGSSSSGHWFIYIYDTEAALWRKYNDEEVGIVTNKQEVLEPDATVTSSYVVYVQDQERSNIIQTVCRDPEPEAQASDNFFDSTDTEPPGRVESSGYWDSRGADCSTGW